MKGPNIYFARHGESEANAAGIIAGWLDSPLTQKGVEQAEVEAAYASEHGLRFRIILSSPLMRALDTAQIIARGMDYPEEDIVILDDLREKGAGDFEGRPPRHLYGASAEEVRAAGAESFDDFALRVQRANREIAKRATAGITLVVAHAGYYRMAVCVQKGLPPEAMIEMDKPMNGKIVEYPL